MNCQIRINKLNRFFNDVVQIRSVLIINELDQISGKILREHIESNYRGGSKLHVDTMNVIKILPSF